MKKKEILSNKNKIKLLFETKSNTINRFPFHVKWLTSEDCETLFTIPVKKIKRANKRNKIKRQLKSIYDKHADYNNKIVVIIYTHTEFLPYEILEKELKYVFNKLK